MSRLEEFPRDRLERAGAHPVVQYRGEILPLVDLRAMLGRDGSDASHADAPLQVVVSSDKGRSFVDRTAGNASST